MDYQFSTPINFAPVSSGESSSSSTENTGNSSAWISTIPSLANLAGNVLGLFGGNNQTSTPTPVTVDKKEDKKKNTKLIIGLSVGFLVLIIALYFITRAKKGK
jgi:hypothetical protein